MLCAFAPILCYNTVLRHVQSTRDHVITLKWTRLVTRESCCRLAPIGDICETHERSVWWPRSTRLAFMATVLVLVVLADVSVSTHNVACECTGHHLLAGGSRMGRLPATGSNCSHLSSFPLCLRCRKPPKYRAPACPHGALVGCDEWRSTCGSRQAPACQTRSTAQVRRRVQ